jgi:hypothetical protein
MCTYKVEHEKLIVQLAQREGALAELRARHAKLEEQHAGV